MRTFPLVLPSAALTLAAALLLTSTDALAEGENVSDTQRCIRLSRIDQSPTIDSRTILVEMKGGGYKRIDLASSCSGLIYNGFSFSTSFNTLCTSDSLDVIAAGGGVCLIDKIVTIDEAEAEVLKAKR